MALDESMLGPVENLDLAHNNGIDVPRAHPTTGEAIVRGAVEFNRDFETFHFLPPTEPSKELWVWDDDAEDYIYVRELTAEEYREALSTYRKEMKRWRDTGGTEHVPGHWVVSGLFATQRGSLCSGIWEQGVGWHWTSTTVRGVA